MPSNSIITVTIKCDACGRELCFDNTEVKDAIENIVQIPTLSALTDLFVRISGWTIDGDNLFCRNCDSVRVGKTVVVCMLHEITNGIRDISFYIGRVMEVHDNIFKVLCPKRGIIEVDTNSNKWDKHNSVYPLQDFEYLAEE